jgi:protein ImuB
VLAKLAPLATNELRVILTLEQAPTHITTLRLPVPMSDSKALLKILHLELSGNPPPAPIVKVLLHAEPVEPRRTQRGLFAASSPDAERLETTLARVRHIVGRENVGSPYLLNTHRPDRFVMHPFRPQVDQLAAKKMPAPETSSWPSIRRIDRESEGVRCETSREPILIPPFLAGHLRAGDQIWQSLAQARQCVRFSRAGALTAEDRDSSTFRGSAT